MWKKVAVAVCCLLALAGVAYGQRGDSRNLKSRQGMADIPTLSFVDVEQRGVILLEFPEMVNTIRINVDAGGGTIECFSPYSDTSYVQTSEGAANFNVSYFDFTNGYIPYYDSCRLYGDAQFSGLVTE